MRISRKVLFELPPVGKNRRNSEGDFIRIPDGRIMFAYTRYYGDTWDDHENSTICAIYSDDGEHFDTENIHTLIRPEQFGGTNAMSVTLISNGSGGISMYFIVKFDTKDITKKPVRDEIYRVDSSDGYEFSGETVLCFPKSHEGYYCINNSRVEVLKNGRIIIPMSEHKMLFDQNKGKYYFDEDGYTITGWLELESGKYWFTKKGIMAKYAEGYHLTTDAYTDTSERARIISMNHFHLTTVTPGAKFVLQGLNLHSLPWKYPETRTVENIMQYGIRIKMNRIVLNSRDFRIHGEELRLP